MQSYSKPQVWEQAEKPTLALHPPEPCVDGASQQREQSGARQQAHSWAEEGGSKASLHHSDLEQFTSFRGPHQQRRVSHPDAPCLYIKLKGGRAPMPFPTANCRLQGSVLGHFTT